MCVCGTAKRPDWEERKQHLGAYKVKRGQRGQAMQCLIRKHEDFKISTETDWKPVQRPQNWGDVLFLTQVRILAAEFCTYCNLLCVGLGTPVRSALQ